MDAIKLPKDIKRILKLLEEHSFSAYLTGDGIRETAADLEPARWNLITNAQIQDLNRIFPESKPLEDGTGIEVTAINDGKTIPDLPLLLHCCGTTIEKYLEGQLFTADAFAYDGSDLIDPYHGFDDAAVERVDTVYDETDLFQQDPVLIMEAILYVGKTNFELIPPLQKAIKLQGKRLKEVDKKTLTQYFEKLIVCPYAGRGIKTLRECGLLSCFVGERIVRTLDKREKKMLDRYEQNIDGTLPILERRLTAFYLGFWKKRDFIAMKHLEYDKALVERVHYAHAKLPDLFFMKKKAMLKHFLYEQGLENYQFLESIAKVQCRLYDLDNRAILARNSMLYEMAEKNEAVFLEDLAITAEDILSAGIISDQKRAEEVLALLPYYVHKHPKFNTKAILLDQAKKLRWNKWKELRLKNATLRKLL